MTAPADVRLADAAARAISAAGEAAYPEECCGLLVGGGAASVGTLWITRAVAGNNVAAGGRRRDRFEVDPRLRFRLMRELADTGEFLAGHYHSHPDHPAEPSPFDAEMAFEADLIWLILAVNGGRAAALRVWRPAAGGFTELPVAIGRDAGTIGRAASRDAGR